MVLVIWMILRNILLLFEYAIVGDKSNEIGGYGGSGRPVPFVACVFGDNMQCEAQFSGKIR